MLMSIESTVEEIRHGSPLLLAGDEQALRTLPAGNWIAGTTPYFMDGEGGVCTRDKVFVNRLPASAAAARILSYTTATLPGLLDDAPDNGFTALIVPAGSPVHAAYARDAANYPGIFIKPVVGWVAGVHMSEAAARSPLAVNGLTGIWSTDDAVAMHVTLPTGKLAEVGIVNIFHPGNGARLQFPSTGFSASTCIVDGSPVSAASYLQSIHADGHLPLTADYNGSIVNVSIQEIDPWSGVVRFFAPVFEGVEYRLAAPVGDYGKKLADAAQGDAEPDFACNCVLNYLHGQMEGRPTGCIAGPVTFGEIAHLLLNQTLVRLFIRG
ncbi:DUF6976 family protein [uncultured Paludibaculum sp.]|uniref:DUF6976 family protein n=1 Tax=uncultured Paludibaculum sp. TaxID=1765020 RepID=UPI002AAB2A81|nr:hypothetical protein [uncultured Paludibaculum sp.]